MKKPIADTAQMAMDLYLQNYRTDEDYFTLEHFKYLCGVVFYKLIEAEYKLQRKESFAILGFTEIILSPDLLIEEVVELSFDSELGFYKGKFKHPVISFPYDAIANGIQSVRNAVAGGCKEFIREAYRRKWALCDLPVTSNVYWFFEGEEIFFKTSPKCQLSKIKVFYASDPSDETFGEAGGLIDKAKEDDIIRGVLDLMFKARNGNIVDMTNDGNPNKKIQTEINTVLTDDLRNKPIG